MQGLWKRGHSLSGFLLAPIPHYEGLPTSLGINDRHMRNLRG